MMAKPYVSSFVIPTPKGQMAFTSVVMDQADFDEVLVELKSKPLTGFTDEEWCTAVDRFQSAQHIPRVVRGSKTAWLFEKFNVKTDNLGVMVRGVGEKILNTIASSN